MEGMNYDELYQKYKNNDKVKKILKSIHKKNNPLTEDEKKERQKISNKKYYQKNRDKLIKINTENKKKRLKKNND